MSVDKEQIPLNWTWVELGEVAESVRNGIYVSRPGVVPDGVPILRIGAVRPLRLDLSDLRYTGMEAAEVEELDGTLSPSDLLFTRYNGNPEFVGACARVPDGVGDLTYPDKLIRVRLAPGVFDSRFVCYMWASEGVRRQVREYVKTSAGQVGIAGGSLKKVRLPLPPLAEQHRIVEALEEQLSRLDMAERAAMNVRRSQPQLVGAFKSALLHAKGNLPAGWHWRELADVVERVEAGKSFRCEPRPAEDGEWGVIKVSAMTWGKFRQGEQKAVPVGREIDARYEIRAGDILVSRANTPEYVGAPVLVRQTRSHLLLSDKSLRLIPKSGVSRHWLITVLSAPLVRQQITARATGSKDSMRNISQRDLLSVRVPVPPSDEQKSLADRADEVLTAIEGAAREVERVGERAGALRKAILGRAFAGQLVAQDPADEQASMALDRMVADRVAQLKPKRTRKVASSEAEKVPRARGPRPATAPAPEPTPAPSLAVQQEFDL
ncbi:hypothetical protein [Streptomyces sp. NPDC093544]|uniref:restriction endonuclease subunit S n=1 Tax=Streptomyces sp. NPDC093544 TaxID=3155200 RepID=UPI003415B8AB